jgi:hypothetical protein
MRSHWRLAALAVVVSGLWVSAGESPAFAQRKPPSALSDKDKKDIARKEYKEGERLLKLNKFKEAFDHYKAADDVLPIAATKYKMALCLDKVGKVLEAAQGYQAFLDSSPSPEKLGDAIADAKTRLDLLKRTPGRVTVVFDPPTAPKLTVKVDDGAATRPPNDRTLAMPPGHHKITAAAAGFDPTTVELDLGFAETREVKLVLRPPAPAGPPVVAVGPKPPVGQPPVAQPPVGQPPVTPAPEPQPTRGPSRIPSYVLFGVAGAGAAVGAVFGAQALTAKSDFNKSHSLADADKEASRARIADAALFSALGVAVIGTVLLFVPRAPAAAPATRGFVTPYVGPNGGGAAGVITF